MEKIKLNFINRSDDTNNSSIVIFQQNVSEDFGEQSVAWKVIEGCGKMDNHPFTYPINFQVSANDSYGNYSPMLDAAGGQAFEMVKDFSGDILRIASRPATSQNAVEVRNSLPLGAIDANCYKDGKLLAIKTGLAPEQKAVFEFNTVLYIGAVSQIEEGSIMNAALISQITSQINLLGITSADIVMTGGGAGKLAKSFIFTMENIK